MLSNLRVTIVVCLTSPLFIGCGTLNTGHRDLDNTFNKAQNSTDKPGLCCLAFLWMWVPHSKVECDPTAPEDEKFKLGFEDD
jgi:hypothetical protein